MNAIYRWPPPFARLVVLVVSTAVPTVGQTTTAGQNASASAPGKTASPAAAVGTAGLPTPPDYLIGPEDVLTIVFWREKEISGDVTVRPDGRISLPLVNDILAAGLTPEQLRVTLNEAAGKYVEDPRATVVVKQINSRKVFITGQVAKQGPYPLTAPMTVVQLITLAGGLLEYADGENVSIMRTENGRAISFRFNYDEVKKRRNLKQNIDLKPGDTIIVP